MGKHWKEVKDKIEKDLDRIMWEEPAEVKMSRLGAFPSGAGTDGQYLANLLFLVADTQAMSWWTSDPAMQRALADPDMGLEHCKKMWIYINSHMAHLMGDISPPACPAPWMNLPTLSEFCDDIIECFDTIETKDELADLLWSWHNYTHRMNRWFFLVFPWHLGDDYPRLSKDEIKQMVDKGELPREALGLQ
jgi:hypothetical protein